jgi:AcrR family transcriptional regulator
LPSRSRKARDARAERARATRARIVAAAGPLFVRDGYLETTMSGIARAAGVAVQTLYLSFGSKAAVLEAALTYGHEDHPNERIARLRAESDGPTALRRYTVDTAARIESHYPLDAVLRAAAADPEPAELLDRTRQAALAAHASAVDELAEKPGFTTHISLQRATEIVGALLSPETYGLLVVGQGWATPDWADWVAAHLTVDLFPNAAGPQAHATMSADTGAFVRM